MEHQLNEHQKQIPLRPRKEMLPKQGQGGGEVSVDANETFSRLVSARPGKDIPTFGCD